MTVGDTLPARYRIDHGVNLSGTATAVSTHQVKIPLPGHTSLCHRMQRGNLLTVVVNSKTKKFKLTSSNRLLEKLFSCVRERRQRREYQ